MATLDLRGAAALMKVNPRTVEAMARDGRLPAAKIGRAYVLMERVVLAFIERQITAQTAARSEGKPTGGARRGGAEHRAEVYPLR